MVRLFQWRTGAAVLGGWLFLVSNVVADRPDARHGSVSDGKQVVSFEGGLTLTWQQTEQLPIEGELLASLDLVTTLPRGQGVWTLYVEGCATPPAKGIASRYPTVNADAGTAPDGEGNGRLQISEFHYTRAMGNDSISIGLLNPAVFLDASEVANDETRQFLASALVNNPTIAFPDYTPGVAFHHEAGDRSPGMTLLLTRSTGLAENGGSYSRLFSFGRGPREMFVATEFYWQPLPTTLRLGVWYRDRQVSEPATVAKEGVYGLMESVVGRLRWSLRGGIAGWKNEMGDLFVGAAGELPVGGGTLGIGVVNSELHGERELLEQVECYWRAKLEESLQLSADIQWLSRRTRDGDSERLLITGLRLAFLF